MQDEIFEEKDVQHILPVQPALIEGPEVFQVISLLNDINEKQVNLRRKRNPATQSPLKAVIDPEQVHLQEDFLTKNLAGITPSIGRQQQSRGKTTEQRARAMTKILEQGHKRQHQNGPQELKRKKKRKLRVKKPEPVVPETSESEFELKALQLGRADSQRQVKMGERAQSIGYLQTLQEVEAPVSMRRADSSVLSRSGRLVKVYKPTPSMKKLPELFAEVDGHKDVLSSEEDEDLNDQK